MAGHRISDALFAPLVTAFIVIVLVLYAIAVRYDVPTGAGEQPGDASQADYNVNEYYSMMSHVSIMIFTGFGFLMTFLKKFGYSAVGINLLLSCIALLWNMLVRTGACTVAVWQRGATARARRLTFS